MTAADAAPFYIDVPIVVEGVLRLDVDEWNMTAKGADVDRIDTPESLADYVLGDVVALTLLDRDMAIPICEIETGRGARTSVLVERLRLASERVQRVDVVLDAMRQSLDVDLAAPATAATRHWIERLEAALDGGTL